MILQTRTSKPNNVAIYCRLSVDDGNLTLESSSISNQKDILTKYVQKRGWHIFNYYIDDGISGTTFNRKGFQDMLLDIEQGLIDTVITKDLSRLGRDYLKTGFYLENYFPDHNIRYIAISDGVDTFEREDDFIPFRNIINEMYAKDISKKIRFTINNQIKNGESCKTSLPLFGYMYDEESNRIPDPISAPIVQLIYDKFICGYTYSEIGRYLKENKIMTPLYYNYTKYGYGTKGKGICFNHDPYSWSVGTLSRILGCDEYTGLYRRGKTKQKFKSKKKENVPKEMQYVFEEKFKKIISKEKYYHAQEIKETIINKKKTNYSSRYAGLVFCGLCHKRLGHKVDVRVNRSDFVRLTARTHCSKRCGTILYNDLDKVLKKELMNLKQVILKHKDIFINLVKKTSKETQKSNVMKHNNMNQLNLLENNLNRIDLYIKRVFEQYNNGIIPKSSYANMISIYSKERNDTNKKINDIIISKQNEITLNYVKEANKIFEIFEILNPVNCLQDENIRKIISKIYITTDGLKKRREKMNKEIKIVYHHIDNVIKEFLNNEK